MTDTTARPEIRVPRRNAGATLAELTLLVRIPGHPGLANAYTDEQAEAARQYAAKHGGTIVPLPLDDGPWDWERGTWRTTDPEPVAAQEHNTRSEYGQE
ncbi:Uncharacterised protein [Mycobacteroides abscessus subsp. abscessus]|nr:Uncharacterised protein [Mycobacteroides abscessus subsp. abscessus]SLG74826.1 Uncharacterised protein [Mycobacteroides abscessus subsp. abscessus]